MSDPVKDAEVAARVAFNSVVAANEVKLGSWLQLHKAAVSAVVVGVVVVALWVIFR